MSHVTVQELARRMIRSRNWHLLEAGRARLARQSWAGEVNRHEEAAERLDDEIRELGFDPQPPRGPRAA